MSRRLDWRYIPLVLWSLFVLIPLYWVAITAFKGNREVYERCALAAVGRLPANTGCLDRYSWGFELRLRPPLPQPCYRGREHAHCPFLWVRSLATDWHASS